MQRFVCIINKIHTYTLFEHASPNTAIIGFLRGACKFTIQNMTGTLQYTLYMTQQAGFGSCLFENRFK
jgi:hypothetical protein